MHEKKLPITRFPFAALLCLQAITLTAMLLISYFGDEDAYLSHVKRLMNTAAIQTIQNVDNLLFPGEDLAVATASLMDSAVLPVAHEENLERYFFENLRIHTNFEGMYFGWVNGDFLYVTRTNPGDDRSPFLTKTIEKMPNGIREVRLVNRNRLFIETNRQLGSARFDPRERPWFKAIKKGSIRWTQPYIFHTSQRAGVTVSIPVVNPEGEAFGVLGLDVQIENLSSYLSKNELSPNSVALIVSDDHKMVAHTDMDLIFKTSETSATGQVLANIEEIDDPAVNAALGSLTAEGLKVVSDEIRSIDFQHENERHYAVFHSYNKFGVSWTVIVISPESDFISEIRNGQFWQIVSAVLVSLLVTMIAYLVVLRFLKPVEELQETVLRNSLTGLYNRRALDDIGIKSLAKSQNNGQAVSVAIIDIDKFKVINDTFGHNVGDEVLVCVSQRMKSVLKRTDLIVRYGGEEFVVLFFDADLKASKIICERLKSAVKNGHVQTECGGILVTVSIGVCEIGAQDNSYHPALSRADEALFTAKRNGRDQVCSSEDTEIVEPALNL